LKFVRISFQLIVKGIKWHQRIYTLIAKGELQMTEEKKVLGENELGKKGLSKKELDENELDENELDEVSGGSCRRRLCKACGEGNG
jgi:bacteriocin-like protein